MQKNRRCCIQLPHLFITGLKYRTILLYLVYIMLTCSCSGVFIKETIARNDHGNTLGGVRSTYLDVPTAAYNVVSTKKPDHASAPTRCEMIAHAIPFSKEKLIRLYGTKDEYVKQVTARIDELVQGGWYLETDADEIKREAEVFEWP